MDTAGLWLIAALTLFSLILSTLNYALKTFSRHRLESLLSKRGQQERLDRLTGHLTELSLGMSCLRQVVHLGLILAVVSELGPKSVIGSFGLAAVLILLFGVAIPQAWSYYAGELLLARVEPLLALVRWILQPLTFVLRPIAAVVRRLAGVTDDDEGRHVAEEILSAVSEGEHDGVVGDQEKEIIESVIKFAHTNASEIMTPRTDMVTVERGAGLNEVIDTIREEGHSRIPVYEKSVDNVVGVLYAKDLLVQLGEGGNGSYQMELAMREPFFVPETKSLDDLLREFKRGKVHMAIVLDEYGGTAGLVTIEDILEEIVGEITDEYEPPEPEPFVLLGEDTAEVDAKMHIDDLNDELKVELPDDRDVDTVGGFVFSELGRIPKSGETFEYDNLTFTVLAAEARRVSRLKIEVKRNQHQSD